MSDGKIIVPDELVREYSRIKQVSLEQARANLEANIRKESEGVDLVQQYQTLIKAFRTMSPQLNGVVMREADIAVRMKSIESTVSSFQREVDSLNKRLDFERDTYKQAMLLLNGILESRRLPLHIRLWNRIKCLLSN